MKEVKYRKIIAHLRTAIHAGRYKGGQRLPSESALVRQFDASRPTVIRALRELQADGLIERRVGSGTYVRIDNDPSSPTGRTFGVLAPGLPDGEIFEAVCAALARHAQSLGHTLLWGDLPGDSAADVDAAALRVCESYVRAGVAGVVFSPLEFSADKERASRRIVRMLDEAKIPLVLLDRDFVEPPARSPYDLVGVDNHRVGFLLARHLLSRGDRVIHFLARRGSAPTVHTRITGYQAALWERGIAPDPEWVLWGEADDVAFVRDWMRRGKPDAVVCANDKTAALLMQTLEALRLNVPRDVRVVGVDDLRYAKLLRPALTTFHQPCQLLAAVTLHTLVERLANPALPPRHVMLAGELVVRESCGARATRSTRK